MAWKIRKLTRFILLYGPSRVLFKVAGRLRFKPFLGALGGRGTVGVIGCGQFAFSTVSYFLRNSGQKVLACYDVDRASAETFARSLGVPIVCASADALLNHPGVECVFVTSNHASHAAYAASALHARKVVYVEKPIAVTTSQLISIERAKRRTGGLVYAGYNRPFSPAICELRDLLDVRAGGGISFSCFVAGHLLDKDHWYRRPGEGTRICGNLGHWIDLFLHMLAWRGMPDHLSISLNWAAESEPDDNLVLSVSSDLGDICAIMLTSRSEPFEGINESIQIQHSTTLCKIDDFRTMTVWKGGKVIRKRYWPKDPGHRMAIAQPFSHGPGRDWAEVLLSTLLMLRVAQMVQTGTRFSTCSVASMMEELESAVLAPNTDLGS